MENQNESDVPIYKRVGRKWKLLPVKGDDVTIKDPKLKQGYLGDLDAKTVIELEEVHQRNEQLLNNKFLLSKLKDKGKRLLSQQKQLTHALERARDREKATKAVPNESDIHGFEWTGSLINNAGGTNDRKEDMELDDKELCPLRLMANHSCIIEPHDNKITRMTEEEDPSSVIIRELKQLNLKDAEHTANSQEVPTFGTKRDQMFQEKYVRNGPAKSSFKPFRPVKNPQPLPGIFVKSKPLEMKPVLCISQQEAQNLEKEFLDKEMKREMKHMIEGLDRTKKGQHISEVSSSAFGKYRDTNIMKHILDSDDEEVDDEEAYDTYVNGIYDDDDDDDS